MSPVESYKFPIESYKFPIESYKFRIESQKFPVESILASDRGTRTQRLCRSICGKAPLFR